MSKNDNVIRFYLLANELKNKIRSGWIQVGISKKRLESVAEHVFGCLTLAVLLDGEHELNLDMLKVFKMLTLHETEEIIMQDYTLRDGIKEEDKISEGKRIVKEITSGLTSQEEIVKLLDEFNERKTKEAIFCYHVDKIECDFQAKVYDLNGVMDYENAKEDLAYYGSRADEIKGSSRCASDLWIEYDRPKYADDELFSNLLDEIKKIDNTFLEGSLSFKKR
ncbi:MAG: HD domain-containing protein [Bacilli bacterium]|nr:HD domain-containing protein [Bacilli bacterium]